ncbi:hypothetical protein ACFL0V_07590, partial [Nanoarchaeota archaeon]
MKKIITITILLLLLLQTSLALSTSDAKRDWLDAKQESKNLQQIHREAKADFAGDKSEGNRQRIVETGKDVLNAALDEAELWLEWKEVEAQENPQVPDHIVDAISQDVTSNIEKIDALRDDVDAIENQFGLGVTFLKMIGKYTELLADVSRNSGNMWVYIADTHADKIEDFEQRLRDSAEDNPEALDLLDQARDELDRARRNINDASDVYEQVKVPGTPLLKFAEGNNYLRAARTNLLAA